MGCKIFLCEIERKNPSANNGKYSVDLNNEQSNNGTIQLPNYWKFAIQAMAWTANKKFVIQVMPWVVNKKFVIQVICHATHDL